MPARPLPIRLADLGRRDRTAVVAPPWPDCVPLSIGRRFLSRALLGLMIAAVTGQIGSAFEPAPAIAAGGAGGGVPAILPIDQVRPGMKGIGRTVFQGDRIEEFGVEILSVVHNSRPKGDLILFRGEGPVLEHAGIIAGMSGSPVYIDGRLIGAVAFAYSMSKDPVGGITPIGEMLALLPADQTPEGQQGDADAPVPRGHREERGATNRDPMRQGSRDTWDAAGAVRSGPNRVGSTGAERTDSSTEAFERLWQHLLDRGAGVRSGRDPENSPLGNALMPEVRSFESGSGLTELATPVAMAGWVDPLRTEMEPVLRRLGFSATAASGTVEGAASQRHLEPGSAVGVQMVGGDANLAAIGTVTYVDGTHVLAFGHPMVQAGSVSLPMSAAWIHTVLASLNVSTKMGSATQPVGGIWVDRRSGIAGTLGPPPELLPVRVSMETGGEAPRVFHYTVVRQTSLTPLFLPWVVTNSFLTAGWVTGDAIARSEITVHFNGGRTVQRVDQIATNAPALTIGTEAVLPAVLLMLNPFESVRLDSVSIRVSYEQKNGQAVLTRLRGGPQRVEVGDTLRVEATLEPYRNPPEYRSFQIPVPDAWAGKRLVVSAGGAADMMSWDRERAAGKLTPRSLRQLADLLGRLPDDGALVLRVYAREPGVLVEGVELTNLPPSLVSAGAGSGSRAVVQTLDGSLLEERRIPTPWVLSGREAIEVEVSR